MSTSKNLHEAKARKNDEFYTRYEDIEKGIEPYKEELRGKVIYLPCDDYHWSNIYSYFKNNLSTLGLKKLIATCIDQNSFVENPLFDFQNKENNAYKVVVTENGEEYSTVEPDGEYPTGDFRSKSCVELIKEADVIITNPPFSICRQLITIIREHKKKFFLLAPMNSYSNTPLLEMFINREVWSVTKAAVGKYITKSGDIAEGGWAKWITNLGEPDGHLEINPQNTLETREYKTYDGHPDIIEVSKIADYPDNYYGLAGVPVTFLVRYDTEQFDVLYTSWDFYIDGKHNYIRIIVRRKK